MAETVIVGCKLPNGLTIHLGSGRERKVVLNGYNSAKVVGGHGLTTVDKEFWDEWSKLHTDFAPVAAGLIFASGSEKNTAAEAVEKEKTLSGFEGLDPNAKHGEIEKAKED